MPIATRAIAACSAPRREAQARNQGDQRERDRDRDREARPRGRRRPTAPAPASPSGSAEPRGPVPARPKARRPAVRNSRRAAVRTLNARARSAATAAAQQPSPPTAGARSDGKPEPDGRQISGPADGRPPGHRAGHEADQGHQHAGAEEAPGPARAAASPAGLVQASATQTAAARNSARAAPKPPPVGRKSSAPRAARASGGPRPPTAGGEVAAGVLEQRALVDHRQLEVGVGVVDRLAAGLDQDDQREGEQARTSGRARSTPAGPAEAAPICPRSVPPAGSAASTSASSEQPSAKTANIRSRAAPISANPQPVPRLPRVDREAGKREQADKNKSIVPSGQCGDRPATGTSTDRPRPAPRPRAGASR